MLFGPIRWLNLSWIAGYDHMPICRNVLTLICRMIARHSGFYRYVNYGGKLLFVTHCHPTTINVNKVRYPCREIIIYNNRTLGRTLNTWYLECLIPEQYIWWLWTGQLNIRVEEVAQLKAELTSLTGLRRQCSDFEDQISQLQGKDITSDCLLLLCYVTIVVNMSMSDHVNYLMQKYKRFSKLINLYT